MQRRIWVAAVAGLMMAAGVAHADLVDDVKKKGELVVGVLGTDEPMSFIDPKTRELVGYDVDLGKAVAWLCAECFLRVRGCVRRHAQCPT